MTVGTDACRVAAGVVNAALLDPEHGFATTVELVADLDRDELVAALYATAATGASYVTFLADRMGVPVERMCADLGEVIVELEADR